MKADKGNVLAMIAVGLLVANALSKERAARAANVDTRREPGQAPRPAPPDVEPRPGRRS